MSTAPQVERLQPVADRTHYLPSAGDWTQAFLNKAWDAIKWITQRVRAQRARKNLRVCESVSLGEKRFVAVLQIDDQRFLIAGSSGSVSLLTRLQEAQTFAAVLDREAEKIS
jgi:flagellar biogenesis protein FliO